MIDWNLSWIFLSTLSLKIKLFGTPIFFLRVSVLFSLSSAVKLVASCESVKLIAWNISLASFAVFAKGPIWSSELPIAMSPYLETDPYVGFSPMRPVNDAG